MHWRFLVEHLVHGFRSSQRDFDTAQAWHALVARLRRGSGVLLLDLASRSCFALCRVSMSLRDDN
jgi:hypothetical protein